MKMRKVRNVFGAYQAYEESGKQAGGLARWKRENQAVWDIIDWVEELREKQNG